MSDIKKEDHVLEAIDQLRRRKARPDSHRICNFLWRRFCIDRTEALALLNSVLNCVPPKVLKVSYKGFTSYRRANAVKVKDQPADYSAVLASALSELIVEEPDYLDFGVPPDEFEKFLIKKDKTKFTKKNVNSIIQAEIDKGNLVSLETGNLSLVDSNSSALDSMDNSPFKSCSSSSPCKDEPEDGGNPDESIMSDPDDMEKVRGIILGVETPEKKTKITPDKTNGKKRKFVYDESKTLTGDSDSPPAKEIKLESEGFRDGVRRKRAAKKVFDPSESSAKPQMLTNSKRGRKSKSDAPAAACADDGVIDGVLGKSKSSACCVCHSAGAADRLVSCRDCSNKAHASCTERKQESTQWQCQRCKTCCVCLETDEYAPMIVCSLCDNGYHFSCHMPQVAYKPKVSWACSRCLDTVEKLKPAAAANQAVGSPPTSPPASRPASPAPAAPPSTSSSGVSSGGADDVVGGADPRVPDATDWSVDQVADYLAERGYPEQAAAFREHEIDGTSLLLMKRSDVLRGLQMKLGPALKAYKQVKRLQIRRSELYLLWA